MRHVLEEELPLKETRDATFPDHKETPDATFPDHIALAYDAWAPVDSKTGKVPDGMRAEWLSKLANTEVSSDYKHSFGAWKASFSSVGDRFAELTLKSRLLVGHGNASATDVGLTVHHTWGVPLIPGSALKGLLAHYVDTTYGPSDADNSASEPQGAEDQRARYQGITWDGRRIKRGPGEVYRTLFGAPDAAEDDRMRAQGLEAGATSGLVTFHDALYVPDSVLDNKPFAVDVLTVHQKTYYDSSGKHAPNDYDSPNPVSFLTVRPKCRLWLVLGGPSEWTELASRLLADALGNWGVGGKTSAGYGVGKVGKWTQPKLRASRDLEEFEAWLLSPSEATQRARLNELKEKWLPRLVTLSPAERSRAADLIRKKLKSPSIRDQSHELAKSLEEGKIS